MLPSIDSSIDSSLLQIGAWRPEHVEMGQEAAGKVAGEQWEYSSMLDLLLVLKNLSLVVLHST